MIRKGREKAVRSSPTAGALAAADDGSVSADIINKVALANTALNGGSFIRVGCSKDGSFSVDANLVDGTSTVAGNGGRGVDEARVSRVTRWAHALESRDGSRKVSNALAEVTSTRAARLDAKSSVGGVVAGGALGAHTSLVGNITRRADASVTESSGVGSSSGGGNANGVGILGTASVHARSEVGGRSTAGRRIRDTVAAHRARASHRICGIVHVTLHAGTNESTCVELLANTIRTARNRAGRSLIGREAI